eukprot:scaffold808_cov196-Alexandrium_tamarense.AAC.93
MNHQMCLSQGISATKGVNIRWIEEHSHPENAVISPRYWYTSIKGPPDKPSDLHAESPPHDGIVKSNHSK